MNDSSPPGVESRAQLVWSALDGDRQARERLIRLCTTPVWRGVDAVFRGTRPREDVEDAMQRAFMDLLEALPRLRQHESLLGFAYRVGYRAAQKFLSSNKEERAARVDVLAPGNEVIDTPQPGPDVEETLVRHELVEKLRHVLVPQLCERDAHLFSLHYDQDLGAQEIADRLGLKRNHVDQILYQIRQLAIALHKRMNPDR